MIERINLQLFAQGGGAGEKTEKATPKKRQDARKKGQVLQSREISSAMVLMFVFVTLRIFGSGIYRQITEYTRFVFTEYPKMDDFYMPDILTRIFIDSVTVMLKAIGPILLVAVIAGTVAGYAQVGFLFTLETLSVKFSRINPLSGFKRIFSMHGAVEMVKSILKISIIGYVAYSYINGEIANILRLMDMDVISIASFIGLTSLNVAIRICVVLIILGVFDYAYQWWEYEKNLRMSKQEVKEEFKQTEGNPEIKSKIKQRQRQMSMRRMMQEVPKADVVITNPTHYACAIKYDAKVSSAPIVVAKGQDYIAVRIKETARENKVEIVENKVLARTIYETVDIGEMIPHDLYQAVAEILAFVYSLKGKNRAV
jgi:flagellar biosynthetic protein FlhB